MKKARRWEDGSHRDDALCTPGSTSCSSGALCQSVHVGLSHLSVVCSVVQCVCDIEACVKSFVFCEQWLVLQEIRNSSSCMHAVFGELNDVWDS